MHSIGLALAWEFWRRGRWQIAAAVLGMIAAPAVVLWNLNLDPSDAQDQPARTLHFVFATIQWMTFGAAVLLAAGNPARLYVRPIATAEIVFWQLAPGMLAVLCMSLATTQAINAWFRVEWPLWGPALFFTVAWPVGQAAIWLGGKSVGKQLVWLTLAATLAGGWFKLRYGRLTGPPLRYWQEVTTEELWMLLAMLTAAWATALASVARDRRGDTLVSSRLKLWLESPSLNGSERGPFRSAARAQFWHEFTQKGRLLPVLQVAATLVAVAFWGWNGFSIADLDGGVTALGGLLCVLGVTAGLLCGSCGPVEGRIGMGGFLATRPVSDASLAASVLQNTAASVVGAWLVWVITKLAAMGLASAAGGPVTETSSQELWQAGAILVMTWTVTAVTACVILAGRPALFLGLLIGISATLIGGALIHHFYVPEKWQAASSRGMCYGTAGGCLLLTAWLFVRARRRGQIGWMALAAAAGAWLLLATAVWNTPRGFMTDSPTHIRALLTGFLGLAVAPLAAAPLAVSWNRHR